MTLEKYPQILQTLDTVLLKEHKGHNMSQHQQSIDLKQHTVKLHGIQTTAGQFNCAKQRSQWLPKLEP